MQKLFPEKYSGALTRVHKVTNRQLCEALDPIHNKIYKAMSPRIENMEEYAKELKGALTEADELVQNSYIMCEPIGSWYKDRDSACPISARQSICAELVMTHLKDGDIELAFHELYDAIDDFGYSQKKWDGEYKSISCNERTLFHVLIMAVIHALDEKYPECMDNKQE